MEGHEQNLTRALRLSVHCSSVLHMSHEFFKCFELMYVFWPNVTKYVFLQLQIKIVPKMERHAQNLTPLGDVGFTFRIWPRTEKPEEIIVI